MVALSGPQVRVDLCLLDARVGQRLADPGMLDGGRSLLPRLGQVLDLDHTVPEFVPPPDVRLVVEPIDRLRGNDRLRIDRGEPFRQCSHARLELRGVILRFVVIGDGGPAFALGPQVVGQLQGRRMDLRFLLPQGIEIRGAIGDRAGDARFDHRGLRQGKHAAAEVQGNATVLRIERQEEDASLAQFEGQIDIATAGGNGTGADADPRLGIPAFQDSQNPHGGDRGRRLLTR